jgi:uncharacterized protein (DUF427 family)
MGAGQAQQESVWDYPRPPRVERTQRRIRAVHRGVVIVDTRRALRVLETSHPPTYYVPLADVVAGVLEHAGGRGTVCEWKGTASYLDLVVDGARVPRAAWTYETPRPGYEALRGTVAFYPQLVDECWVDDDRARPQEGSFYGGWVTAEIAGPFKRG